MNRIFRLVWSFSKQSFVVASEVARSCGKKSTGVITQGLLIAAPPIILLASSSTLASPINGQVVSGNAAIVKADTTTTINQATDKVIINWDSFNVAAKEQVNFVQPSVNAVALNRIQDSNGSQILGSLNANGHVFLVNPNGITIGVGAEVNVNGFVASTLDISNTDFISGNYVFEAGGVSGKVQNAGEINAHTVALLGGQVVNTGVITATKIAGGSAGKNGVALVSGSKIKLDLTDRLSVITEGDVADALVDNQGDVIAHGGRILLNANNLQDSILPSVVKNAGNLKANSLGINSKGEISLIASGKGEIELTGMISAKSTALSSEVITRAGKVRIGKNASVETVGVDGNVGNWKISSEGFKVAVKDGDLTGSVLSGHLAKTAIEINGTIGNVEINDDISWSSSHLLSIYTDKDIVLHKGITSTGNNPSNLSNNKYANAGLELKAKETAIKSPL